MKSYTFLTIAFFVFCNLLCCQPLEQESKAEETWRLGWRMIENSMDEKYDEAEAQFDSLLAISHSMDEKFILSGLEVKSKQGKSDEVSRILSAQSKEVLGSVCMKEWATGLDLCSGIKEEVENVDLQMELLKMYVDDQFARGNRMNDIINKYQLDTMDLFSSGLSVDGQNQKRLIEIINEYGFPTCSLVGKDAMKGIFLIVQHADRDKEWQKSQLLNIEEAVKNGDMDGQSYVYLYDRIKINAGEKQLYGTQFSKVDPIKMIVELAETEDLENLDKRRMEVGIMPIDMYKRFMLKALKR